MPLGQPVLARHKSTETYALYPRAAVTNLKLGQRHSLRHAVLQPVLCPRARNRYLYIRTDIYAKLHGSFLENRDEVL